MTEGKMDAIDCRELLPQGAPYVMVDVLTRHDEGVTVTELTVAPDNYFVVDGRMCGAGLVENMSQSCAARIGYINKYIRKSIPRPGVVAAIKTLEVHGEPMVGETVVTRVRVVYELEDMLMAAVETVAKNDGRLLLTAEGVVVTVA